MLGIPGSIARRVMRREVFAGAHPGKYIFGILPLQLCAHRAVADQYQSQLGIDRLHGLEGAQHQRHVLFCGDAAHVDDHQFVFGDGTPLHAQLFTALAGVEQGSVHPARDDLQVPVAILRQRVAQLPGRDQCGISAVVQVAQVCGNRLVQPAEAVMLAVTVEVGMEIAADRDAELARGGQCG